MVFIGCIHPKLILTTFFSSLSLSNYTHIMKFHTHITTYFSIRLFWVSFLLILYPLVQYSQNNYVTLGDAPINPCQETIFTLPYEACPTGGYLLFFTLDNPIIDCPDTSDTLMLTIYDANAGIDDTVEVCNDMLLVLTNYNTGGDAGGTWSLNPTTPNVPIPDVFNETNATFETNNHPSGTYIFNYILGTPQDACTDTATITVIITETPSITLPDLSFCETGLSLQDVIDNTTYEIGNGLGTHTLYYSDDNTPPGTLTDSANVAGPYELFYEENGCTTFTFFEVNENCACPMDLTTMDDLNICSELTFSLTATVVGDGTANFAWVDLDLLPIDPNNIVLPPNMGCEPVNYSFFVTGNCVGDGSIINTIDNDVVITIYPTQQEPDILLLDDLCQYQVQPICPMDSLSIETFVLPPGSNANDTIITVISQYPEHPCASTDFMVNYEECASDCPTVDITTPPAQCVGSPIIDIELFISSTAAGTWNQIDGPTPNLLTGTTFNTPNATVGEYTLAFIVDEPITDCPEQYNMVITVIDGANAGTATNNTLCINDLADYNLNGLLTGANTGGFWEENPTNPLTGAGFINNGTLTPANYPIGDYEFLYIINSTCGNDTAFAMIQLNENPTVEFAFTELAVCNTTADGSIVNFNNFINSGDMTGTWFDTQNTGVDLTDLSSVDFNTVPPIDFEFTYITNSAVSSCDETEYTVTVSVLNCLCSDVSTRIPNDSLCSANAAYTLSQLVNSPSTEGYWTITNTPLGNSPATIIDSLTFITDGSDEGVYTIRFTPYENLPADCEQFSEQELWVFNPANAGDGGTGNLCNTDNIAFDLIQLIENAPDTDGTWHLLDGIVLPNSYDPINGTLNPLNQEAGIYQFSYVVEGMGNCPVDSTIIAIEIEGVGTMDVVGNIVLCETLPDSLRIDLNTLLSNEIEGNWEDISNSGAGVPVADFNNIAPGSYMFEFTPISNCTNQTYPVLITKEACSNWVTLPNAFSPNNDGINDKFREYGSNLVEINLTVYNRWGQLVFETNTLGQGWDGTFNNEEQDIGTYIYYIKATFDDGTSEAIKGTVTLIR